MASRPRRNVSTAINGRTDVMVECGSCDGCRAGAKCLRPTLAEKLPDPCCTWCGHNPHDGACPGCPCAFRAKARRR